MAGWLPLRFGSLQGPQSWAQGAPLALQRHLHLRHEAFAHQHRPVHHAVFSREARLALAGVLLVPAVLQRQARPVLRLGQVHVVLLQLLQGFHVLLQEEPSPRRAVHRAAVCALVLGAAQRQGGGAVLRPVRLRLLPLLLPLLGVVVDGAADVGRVGAVLAEEVHLAFGAQLVQLGERRELVVALHEELFRAVIEGQAVGVWAETFFYG